MLYYVQIMLQYVQIGVLKIFISSVFLETLQRENFCQHFLYYFTRLIFQFSESK